MAMFTSYPSPNKIKHRRQKIMEKSLKTRIRKEFESYVLLLRSIPSVILALFVVSIVGMNLLANKSIDTGSLDWLALDCGILLSWLAFLTMDVLVRRFGPKAATQISITAICINLLLCLVFFIASLISGSWGESYIPEGGNIVNQALNNTFGGTWYVLLGSTIACIASSFINNFLNWSIGKLTKHHKHSFANYALRSYVSTAVGQFFDNLIFSLIVSINFFGWSLLQCFTCALTGAIVELLCEVVFSPIGYKLFINWENNNVGKDYLAHIEKEAN